MNNREKFLQTWTSDRKFFNASQLKILACIFMLISHIAQTGYIFVLGYEKTYYPMMILGRISFPIFCFFIAQGLVLTSNAKKYLLRLLLFALVSEIPFDLAFYGRINPLAQNVFFTLFLGAGLIYSLIRIEERALDRTAEVFSYILLLILFMSISILLRTDYSYRGVLAMFLLYLGRNKKLYTVLALLVGFYFEAHLYGVVYLAIIFLYFYNGKKGKMNKWAFYLFYPGHLLLIYFLMNHVTY